MSRCEIHCPRGANNSICVSVAVAVLAVASATCAVLIGDVLTAALVVLSVAAAAIAAFLVHVLRRDGLWVGRDFRTPVVAQAPAIPQAPQRLAIEAPKPRPADIAVTARVVKEARA